MPLILGGRGSEFEASLGHRVSSSKGYTEKPGLKTKHPLSPITT